MKTLIILLALTTGKPKPERQPGFWWKQGGIVTMMFTAGIASYQNEVTQHNWRRYAARHPGANPQWYNPVLSARNKYKNRDPNQGPAYPGSTTWLAFITDKYHLNRMLRNVLTAGSLALTMTLWSRPRWYHVVAQLLFNWAAFAFGTGIAHLYYSRK